MAVFAWVTVILTTSVAVSEPLLSQDVSAGKQVRTPDPDIGVASLPARAAAQRGQTDVFLNFQLQDRIEASGITFVHRIVDDAGRDFKAVHYDHGNGIAAADIDGDGLPDLYFTTQLGANELWRNTGHGRFENVTESAGVGLAGRVSVAATFADLDNDGDPDLYVTTVKMGNVLFENLGNGRFRDVTQTSGLGHVGHSSGAVAFDYNRDGLLDIYLTNVGRYTNDQRGRGGYWIGLRDAFDGHHDPSREESSLLFENRGGLRFTDVTAKRRVGDRGWTGDATFTDFNEDGWPDLYVLNMQGDDHYYENQSGEFFVERAAELFPKTPWGAMGVKAFDFDNDARMDLLLTDMHSDMSQKVGPEDETKKSDIQWTDEQLQGGGNNIFGNAFYHNRGYQRFDEISDQVNTESYWPWGVSVGDLNADGFEDVFMTLSMSYPFRYQPNAVLINERGQRFVSAEFVLGVEPRAEGATHAPWFEVDCKNDNRLKACDGFDGTVTVMGTRGSRSSVFLDIEGDGDLDLITNDFNIAPQVLVSDLSERTRLHYLKVQLKGHGSNRDGLGALVQVFAGDQIYTRYHDGKSGYLSQSSLPLYFGLGDAVRADRVEVVWPNGRRQTVRQGIPTNGRLVITEETAP